MSDVIVQRARSVTGDARVRPETALAVVGHGTNRNENSAKAVEYHADRIRETGRFEQVRALFMDEKPEVERLTSHVEEHNVVLVPLFIADGYHTQEDIPEDVGLTDDHRTGYEVPATVEGHDVWYAGAVGTEPLLAEVLLERASDAGAAVGDAITQVRNRTTGGDAISVDTP
jgi:sirohydrochlorin cobaltochelatase